MCGIAGILNTDGTPADNNVLREMASVLRHRGPDDEGLFCDGNLGFSHRRLSIIDLSDRAHQPMMNDAQTVVVVHNGEIYNYVELRAELESRGHRFRSKSDTEVILRAYEEWHTDCLRRFNGMWAFALWDKNRKELFVARDRFGVKPLYYYFNGKEFIFASEIKALLAAPSVRRAPNDRSIYRYLASGYGYMDISHETFFEGICQVRPAHYLKVSDRAAEINEIKYWDLDPDRKIETESEKDLIGKFLHLFEDSVRLRLRSDVPVGISLSGGLDSSSIASVASKLLGSRPLEGFSSCFEEEEFDERRFIRPVIARTGIRPNYVFAKPENLFTDMDEILWHQEEPYSTLSIFPQWHVMKAARERGVKVLLTGQAGDETLAGYPKYFFFYFADLLKRGKMGEMLREVRAYRECTASAGNVARPTAAILASYLTPESVKRFIRLITGGKPPRYIRREFSAGSVGRVALTRRYKSILNNDLYNAFKISPLPSLLHIDDRSSMAHSVETRSPFLDYRLVEFLFSVPAGYKIKSGRTKYLLRTAMNGILPEEVRLRRDKMGYPTPLLTWFRSTLKKKVEEIIFSREFSKRPYFDANGVKKEFEEYLLGKNGSQYTVWSWVNLELWHRKFID